MKSLLTKTTSIPLFISVLTLTAWSPSSHACSDSPILASVCIMATPTTFGSFNRQYVMAAGQQLQVNQYTALYSLIGTTYGGSAPVTFNLPDLRGKVLIGANTSTYPAGKTGGQEKINLTVAQLPTHNFQFANAPVDLSKVTASTTLTGLTATANLAGISVSGTPNGLTIKASSTSSGQNSPAGNYLGKAPSTSANLYSTATPDTTLNTGTIGGTISLTIPNGTTAPVNISGNATTVIGGTASASGTTNSVGMGSDISMMPPYLALTYYIAVSNATYPSRD